MLRSGRRYGQRKEDNLIELHRDKALSVYKAA
jgi:hypothetical protein